MCFWYQIARPPGTGPVRLVSDLAPVRLVRREDVIAARMSDTGDFQVVRVEGLIGDGGVGPAAEGTHHRGRDVARAGPHGDSGHAKSYTRRRDD